MSAVSDTDTGTIHDLGYRRYAGERRPPARRFWVISRQLVSLAWQRRWGVKLPLLLAGLTTIGSAVAMYLLRHRFADMLRARGMPIPGPEQVIYYARDLFALLAVILATVIGCAAVADDLRTGAFSFYFSRPLRPRDYVAGKLLGISLVVAMPMLGGPLILALFRLALADSGHELAAALPIVPRALAMGLAGTIMIALVAVGFGALLAQRTAAQALFLSYYIAVAGLAQGAAHVLRAPGLRAFAIGADLEAIACALFGIDPKPGLPPVGAAIAAALAMTGLGALLVWRRVRNAEAAGPGGSS